MAAPERFAEMSDSSCTAGAVHTWPCAPRAPISSGGRYHPESCRLIWKLTSGSAGQPEGLEPRDKGRRGRLSDPAGRNACETRAGLESDNADADPPAIWGRLHERGRNRYEHPFDPPG